ncbi:MAG TPA: hypothetical protein VI039_13210 [Solirubrobacterales bacterium]
MPRSALFGGIVAIALLCPGIASAETFGSNGCGESQREPKSIVLACGDGKVVFEVGDWAAWDQREAVGIGMLKHPDLTAPGKCQETVLACPWVESEGIAYFSRPVYCPANKRTQFTRLRIDAPNDPDPELRRVRRNLKCGEYSGQRGVVRLGTVRAARYMRTALAREPDLAFRGSYARKVSCDKRVSRSRVRCKMSWIYGDVEFSGKGVIWLLRSGGGIDWAYAYTVRKRNAYCQATGGTHCVEVITAR